jgi:hypothetical protein
VAAQRNTPMGVRGWFMGSILLEAHNAEEGRAADLPALLRIMLS